MNFKDLSDQELSKLFYACARSTALLDAAARRMNVDSKQKEFDREASTIMRDLQTKVCMIQNERERTK